ncbi:TadE/TadG family type IV pilus assembly protein [Anderseniella sp. Alg231-50]|uniref:TadE/TadG family type IV pilus assembly protein n=1 Tax=Anderseniella sp. Alg231-50 TaxID=1922226 RepID=UPI00307B216B
MSKLPGFGKNEFGSIAPVLGVAAIPLIMAAGAAVDYGNAVSVQARLQAAVDAAALAAGREANMTDAQLERIAKDYFHSNFGTPSNAGTPQMQMTVTDNGLQIKGSVTVSNYLTKVAGFDTTLISAASQVTKEATGLEVVLVFDNTGSMASQSRLSTLKVAAHDFVEILFGPREVADTLKIGVVPFSQFVNVGADKANSGWIDTGGANQLSRENFTGAGTWHNWRAWQSIRNRSWTGCVESRNGNRSVDDDLPDPNNANTLFPPAFYPDEPGNDQYRAYFKVGGKNNYYYNSYLTDSRTNSLPRRQEHPRKYSNARVNSTSRGPDRGCNIQPIQALTNVKSPVLGTINNMQASGYTHVAEGVGWGLRVISPGEPFTEGVDYSDEDITKAMVLLTDGENTFNTETNHNRSTYTAYGYLHQTRVGSANYWTAVSKQNALLSRACNNVKDAGIVSYTFAYNVPSQTQRNLIKNCATDPEKYFDPPSNAALVKNFQQIADELRKLHLSQ